MTLKQKEHYLDGGMFSAIYNPTITNDLREANKLMVGKIIEVHQNIVITPILEIPQYLGDFRFNSSEIDGWIPESDLEDLKILNEFSSYKESLPQYIYKMIVHTDESVRKLFGKITLDIPYCSYRSYSTEADQFVLEHLTEGIKEVEVFKFTWKGEDIDQINWKKLR